MRKTSKKLSILGAAALCAALVGGGFGAISASADVTPDVQIEGAMIRTTDIGLRFLSSVSNTYATEAYNYGTLIVPKAVLGENALTHTTNVEYEDVEQTQWANDGVAKLDNFAYDENRSYFSAVLPIPEGYYGTEIVARSYAEKDGVYYYAQPQVRSVGYVAAKALQDGATNEKLVDIVDKALTGETLAMESMAFLAADEVKTFTLSGGNGYAAIWESSDKAIATVDKNGKVTPVAAGTATITAQVGSQTVSCAICVGGAAQAQKWVDFTADNIKDTLTPSGNTITLDYENGLLKSAYSSYKDNCNMGIKYKSAVNAGIVGKIQFAVYNVQKDGIGFYFNGSKVQDIHNGWSLITVDVSTLDSLSQIGYIHADGYGSMANHVYYVSDIYCLTWKTQDRIIDFNADNYASKLTTTNGNIAITYQDSNVASTFAKGTGNCVMTVTLKDDTDISAYNYIEFAVYTLYDATPDATKLVYFNGTNYGGLTVGKWKYVRVDLSAFEPKPTTLNDIAIKIMHTGWYNMDKNCYLISDIYGVK